LGEGKTKGMFQLEGHLGQTWAGKIKPENIEELGALVSLIRPACLRARSGNPPKSMTERYRDRKLGVEEVDDFDVPELQTILHNTYLIIVYQEDAMQIAVSLAGFNEQDADILRKAIGKKKADVMSQVENNFLLGCEKTAIISKEKAKEIFSWIREAQKYGFNKSHAISYAEGSYWTAYCKAHFPLQFFCSYLRGANWKQDKYEEIATLVNDAKLFNIKVNPPDLRDIQTNFYIKNQELYFGLLEVKQVGESSIVKIQHALKEVQLTLDRQIDNWSWLDYLIFFSDKISSSINKSLILTGATDFFGESRTLMSYHMDCWTQLTKKEKAWIQTKQYESTNNARWTTLHDALCDCAHKKADGGGCHTVRRIQVMQSVGNILRNPPHSLSDSFHFMAWNEEKLLGLPLTCNMVDDCDGAIQANTTCKELLDGKDGYIILAVTINRIKEIHTKKAKKKMAFLTVSDNTYALDSIVCFPDDWKEFKDLLTVSNTVLLHGETSKKGSFIIKQVWQI